MLKWNYGHVRSVETGACADINVNYVNKKNLIDFLTGAIIIAIGFAYTMVSVYKDGIKDYMIAEDTALHDIDAIHEITEEK